MSDDIDRSVWSTIALQRLLTKQNDRMWDAIINGEHVAIFIGDDRIAQFIPHDAGYVRVEVDGQKVADLDLTPPPYPTRSFGVTES